MSNPKDLSFMRKMTLLRSVIYFDIKSKYPLWGFHI